MAMDASSTTTIQSNFDVFCDVDNILGLPCLLPLLECVYNLIKFT